MLCAALGLRGANNIRRRGLGKAPDDLSAWRASNVGVCGSLADGYPDPKTFGGKLMLVTVSGRDATEVSSSCRAHGAPENGWSAGLSV